MRSDVEETENNKDVTDSGYSNSCSNSQSQSCGSSKCSGRNSAGSSGSGSSTFGVLALPIEGVQKESKERKEKKKEGDKKNKKKKNRSRELSPGTIATAQPPVTDEDPNFNNKSSLLIAAKPSSSQHMETGDAEENALQAVALSQTLHSLRKMKYPENTADESEASVKDGAVGGGANLKHAPQSDKAPFEISSVQIASLKPDVLHEGELRIAVSMLDGIVIYTSGLTQTLGYPKDMWIGRSLIDFVHAKHRASFASFIIQSIAELYPGNNTSNGQRNLYFCGLRKYRGLKNGFQVTEQSVNYLPCQITLQFKELPVVNDNPMKECLIISATQVHSAYKYSDETRMFPKFMTRHSVNCQLVHVDHEVTPFFGFLPQDMLLHSVFDFYHPEDLHFLKEVYEAVIKEPGHPFKSKPYRFLCQNGGYALVETELSSFINPWTRKLEFIIGQHSVLRGPPNPDVTTPYHNSKPVNFSEEILKETKIVQEEIKCLLNETVVRSTETAKQQVSKRCQDLAAFMENLVDEITKPPDLKVVVPTEEQSFSERDSVMLGEISPHHGYYDSKSMSETPPSYNQLNYNENIHRFFESKPKTTVSDESSGSGNDHKTGSSGEEGKTSPTVNSSSGSKSGDSGDSSGHSMESNGNSGETTSNDASNNSNNRSNNNTEGYKPPALTEQLLSRHNEDMEKKMVQRHRVSRTKSDRDSKAKERLKSLDKGQEIKGYSGDDPLLVILAQGVKRSGSHSWEGEPYKTIKASHTTNVPVLQPALMPAIQPAHQPFTHCSEQILAPVSSNESSSVQPGVQGPADITAPAGPPIVGNSNSLGMRTSSHINAAPPAASNMWAPFPHNPPNPVPGPASQEFPGPSVTGALLPMYYTVPNQRNAENNNQPAYPPAHNNPINYTQPSVQLMSSMLYHPFMYGTPPIQVYSPIMYPPAAYNMNNMPHTNRIPTTQQRTTSVKKEPDVAAIPKTTSQPAGTEIPDKPGLFNNRTTSDNEGRSNELSTPYDDSSYQSSFYSFLKTDKSDESMKSSSENEKPEERRWCSRKDAENRPVRKVAPWIENVNVTPDLMLKYQLKERGIEETLKDDATLLEKIKQPSLVNDQLSQMYEDLELEGLSKTLTLEEGMTSSSESSGDDTKAPKFSGMKRRKRYMEYDKMTILFEEDAPMPPPIAAQCT
ncbi:Period circadian protein [Nesidiocoris tenuis]|uniref:Period circadian protein n=2 Tax=Nesidiocoris tenuis TaxID=355587 RepID=A0ABN7B897_9HEMI|nr:Period circadian protein [Nesidiocoris tenuis]